MSRLNLSMCNIKFNNPIIPASGTFGFGLMDFFPFDKLGAVITKGTTKNPKLGNPAPRVAETPKGMLNSVGLQNDGIDHLIENIIPYYKTLNPNVIANIAGETIEDFIQIVEKLNHSEVSMIELNISCPNVTQGGMAFGTSKSSIKTLVSSVKKVSKKPIIVKLSPNVTNISEMAKIAEDSGADCISLINTILSMRIDIRTKKPILRTNYGGLSGEAVFPIALRMVNQVYNAVKIPIIGIGGISNWKMAVEMIMAGASMLQIGSATFNQPTTPIDIIDGLEKYLSENNIDNITDLTGSVVLWS